MEGDAQDSVCGGEAWNFTLSEPRFPQICMYSPNQKLSRPHFGGFYGGFITEVQLIKSLAVGDCFNRKPFSLSQTWWQGGTGSSSPLTMWLVPLASSPPTPAFGKSPHSPNKRHLDWSPHLGNSQSFRSSVPGPGDKYQKCISYY